MQIPSIMAVRIGALSLPDPPKRKGRLQALRVLQIIIRLMQGHPGHGKRVDHESDYQAGDYYCLRQPGCRSSKIVMRRHCVNVQNCVFRGGGNVFL